MENIVFRPIGYVKNPIKQRKGMLPGGMISTLIIESKYLEALECIEENSHIIVCCYLHEAKRDVLKVVPVKFGPENREKGVFATRSPDRPTPISFTVTKLLEVNRNRLIVDKLDVIDKTPILDIKPYSIGTDCVYNTKSINDRRDFSIATNEQLYEYLKNGILNYLYCIDKELDLGIYSLIKVIRTINKIPDRTIVDYLETDYTGNALDCVYHYVKYTPGENKVLVNVTKSAKNTYLIIKLKSSDIWKVVNKNPKDSFDSELIDIKKIDV